MRTAIALHELLPEGLYLECLSIETGRVGISAACGTRRSLCPLCSRGSSRVHSLRRDINLSRGLFWHRAGAGRKGLDDETRRGRKGMSLGNLGDLGNLDLGQLQPFLQGVNFPAGNEDVASNAQSNGAPQEVVDRIRNAGTDTFNSADEVLQAVRG